MTSLYLFRHAQSEWNINEPRLVGGRSNHIPLTTEGRLQAQRLGQWIAGNGLEPEVVYFSPAVRTIQTGMIALDAAGLPNDPIVDDRLQELSQGTQEGLAVSEVYTREILERIKLEQKDFKLEAGESMNDVAARKRDWAEYVLSKGHPTIFAFTHGFAIRCYVGSLLDWDHPTVRAADVDNASATILRFDEQGNLVDYEYNVATQAA